MNIRFIAQAIAFTFTLSGICANAQVKKETETMITPVEHATLVLRGQTQTIYVDPVGKPEAFSSFPKPDLILITHMHQDHFDPAVIAKVKADKTEVIGPKNVIDQLKYGIVLENGNSTTSKNIKVEAVPAYNTSPDRTKFHPKGRDNGYVVSVDGKRIYISGDTEDTKEMRALKNIDHALICINLPYTMTVVQAAAAVLEMKPKIVTPYHYRGQNGMSNLEEFKRLVAKDPSIEVRLMDWYTKPK